MIKKLAEDYEPNTTDWSSVEYHMDQDAVSSSLLKLILKSPRSFLSQYRTPPDDEPNEALKLGSALHCLVLEPKLFTETYIQMPDFGDMRTKSAKDERSEWLDKYPYGIALTKKMWDTVFAMGNSIQSHKDAKLLLKNGIAEKTIFYRDRETGLKCKIRPDYYNSNLGVLVDLKTTLDCTADSFSKTIWNYRYDFQMAMYLEGLNLLTGKLFEHGVFIAVEKEPPYEVGVYKVDADLLMKGRIDYRRALDLLSECISKNEWPGYQQGMKEIGLPGWALSKEL